MIARPALLVLFVALTIVLASATVYEAGIKATTLTSTSELTQTSTVTVISDSMLTRTSLVTVSSNASSLVVTKEVTMVLQEQVTQTGCGAVYVTSYLTTSTTGYVIPANGSQGVLTMETTTTTVTSPATTTVTNTTSVSSGVCV